MLSQQLRSAFCVLFMIILGTATATLKTDNACQGSPDKQNCSRHNMQCPTATFFFPLRARRGFKAENLGCSGPVTDCNTLYERCCSLQEGDCFVDYSNEDFTDLSGGGSCLNKACCGFTVPRRFYTDPPCNCSFPKYSIYSTVDYVCISDRHNADFTSNTSISGIDMALTYNEEPTPKDTVISCRVEADDCTSTTADVTLITTSTNQSPRCTTLRVGNTAWLPCGSTPSISVVWKNSHVSTPFTVELQVYRFDKAQKAWAVIHSRSERSLTVTCKDIEDEFTFPECLVPNSTVLTDSPETETSLEPTSSPSWATTMSATTTAEVGEPEIHTSSPVSSTTVLLAGVIGGVVIGVLVLIVGAVFLFFCVRRWVARKRQGTGGVVGFHPSTSAVSILPPQKESRQLSQTRAGRCCCL